MLRDVRGERFMPAIHPRAELAPRDVVSLAIAAQMAKTQHPNVYLDLSHLDAERIRQRFPGIDRLCRTFDLDITRDPIPVCPGAHYMIGGVAIDPHGRTTVSRTVGGGRGDQLGSSRRQSAGFQQPARGPGLRQSGCGRHGRHTRNGRAATARSAAGFAATVSRRQGRDRPGRPAGIAAGTHVAHASELLATRPVSKRRRTASITGNAIFCRLNSTM